VSISVSVHEWTASSSKGCSLCQFYICSGFLPVLVDFHVLCISQVGVMVSILVVVKFLSCSHVHGLSVGSICTYFPGLDA